VLAKRMGVEPAAAADGYLVRAEALSPSPTLADRRTYLLLPSLASALRTKDTTRALLTIERIRSRLQSSRDQELAQRWRESLQDLAAFLQGRPGITWQRLKDDPLLQDMVEDLTPDGR
jgi:hypothetical protein